MEPIQQEQTEQQGLPLTPFDDTLNKPSSSDRLKSLMDGYLDEEEAVQPTPVQYFGQSNIEFDAYDKQKKLEHEQSKAKLTATANSNEMKLNLLYARESAPGKGENYLHKGQEGKGYTSQYGVRQQDFPKLKGETYRQQALRLLTKKVHKLGVVNPRYNQASSELQAAIVPVMWNIGNNAGAVTKFNFDDVKLSAARIMQYYKYTPEGSKVRKPSKGLMAARVKDWNAIAMTPEGQEAGMYPIKQWEDHLKQAEWIN